jgi:CRISPR type IV-associated protein Csf3
MSDDPPPIEIPVQREPEGSFHLCSFSVSEPEVHENRWVNRRFPIPEAQLMAGPKLRRIDIRAGAQKSYRLPLETCHLKDDTIRWWCIGEPAEIEELLQLIGYLGKRRGVGLGAVRSWVVEAYEPWGDGFPVVRDGYPLRPLPPDWPGLAEDTVTAYRTITFPYWQHTREELCAVP